MFFLIGVLMMLVALTIFGVRNYERFFNTDLNSMDAGDRLLVALFAIGFLIDAVCIGSAAIKYLP